MEASPHYHLCSFYLGTHSIQLFIYLSVYGHSAVARMQYSTKHSAVC